MISCLKWVFANAVIGVFLMTIVFLCTESTSGAGLWQVIRKVINSIRKSPPPRILVWNTFFSRPNWLPDYNSLNCSSLCDITYHREDLNESDAVLFHLRDVNVSDLPASRKDGQLWVLLNMEAPPNSPVDVIRALDGKINWTVSYRNDSDVYSPYGRLQRKEHKDAIVLPYRRKKFFVCWIASNCHTSSQREKYVEELKRYVPVRVFGECSGGVKCPTSNVYDCYRHISDGCMFYLAFENSLCPDYATEKLFHALRAGMVPVVMGGANYAGLLPADSYIDAMAFPSVQDLAHRLVEVSKDGDIYDGYLQWRRSFEVVFTSYRYICGLCDKLSASRAFFSPKSFSRWWYEHADCQSWMERLNKSSASSP